ncbi:unnamed protein product [Paramecium sonneborni]|uniref:Uncharacterized protein n=1 Tax=Paramecium sonneborni TaxID=65129 RepID=A0A8S1RRZ2_9CILI|nr:unnamed protein product [Paramecium sonneborni]
MILYLIKIKKESIIIESDYTLTQKQQIKSTNNSNSQNLKQIIINILNKVHLKFQLQQHLKTIIIIIIKKLNHGQNQREYHQKQQEVNVESVIAILLFKLNLLD